MPREHDGPRRARRRHPAVRLAAALLALAGLAPPVAGAGDAPRVVLATDAGEIVVELAPDEAPATVDNFLRYVDDGFYDGTIFHRVIPDFMIQGGGLTPDLERRSTRDPVANESANDLSHERGTLAMARTSDPDSATAQFFINLRDNPHLDGTAGEPGYTVFGRVVAGMDAVDAIAARPTEPRGGHQNVPVEPIVIATAQRAAEPQ